MVEYLNWDSDFFDKTIGKLTLKVGQLPTSDLNRYDLLYIFQEDEFHVEIPNFTESYNETKVIFQKKVGQTKTLRSLDIKSIKNFGNHRQKLYDLAYISGSFSRFKRDKNFKDFEFKSLYKSWIDNSIDFKIADDIFVFVNNNEILGFVSFKLNGLFSKIGLIAIDPSFQGSGIGTKLLVAVENHLNENGVHFLQIPTQSVNVKACQFYKKNGYKIVNKEIIKHFWKHDSI